MDARRAARLDEELAGLLRTAGLRVTRPRVEVLRYFHEAGGHHSADEVVTALRDHAVALPRASVFGIVDALSGAGLLRIALTGPGRTLYEWAGTAHHHFICRVCDRVFDVERSDEDDQRLSRPDFPGEVEEAQIIYRGVCGDCR